MKQKFKLSLLLSVSLVLLLSVALFPLTAFASPSIAITSPTTGTALSGSTETVTGTATASTSIRVLVDDVQKAFVVSDGSGDWSTQLTGLTSGTHTITAEAISSDSVAAFTSIGGTNQLNTIDQSTNTLNSSAGWPVSLGSDSPLMTVVSPDGTTAYITSGGVIPGDYVAKVDLTTPGSPQVVSAYPASSGPTAPAFSADGSTLVIGNKADGTVTFIDVATNAIISTISTSLDAIDASWTMPNGLVYLPSSSSSAVSVVDPSDQSLVSTFTVCDGVADSLSTITSDPSNSNQYFTFCKTPAVEAHVRSLSDNSIIRTLPMANASFGAIISPNGEEFAAPRYGDSILDIYSTSDGSLLHSISTTASGYVARYTPDGQKIYEATPGSFDTTNLDVIDTSDWSVTQVALPGVGFLLDFINSSGSTASTSVQVSVAGAATTTPSAPDTGVGSASSALSILSTLFGTAILVYISVRLARRKALK